MNYEKLYYAIIEKAKTKERKKGQGEYYENHHIIPSKMGGPDHKDNMVLLTGREHIICHYLLMKFVKEEPFATYMKDAVNGMCNQEGKNQTRYKLNSKLYEKVKKENALVQSKRTLDYIAKYGHPMTGYVWSEEQNRKKSELRKGIVLDVQWKERITEGLLKYYAENEVWNKGVEHSEGHKSNISKSLLEHYEKNPSKSLGRKLSENTKQKLRDRVLVDHGKKTSDGMTKEIMDKLHAPVECEYCHKMISRQNYARAHGTKCKSLTGESPFKQPKLSCVVCRKEVTPSSLSRFHKHEAHNVQI